MFKTKLTTISPPYNSRNNFSMKQIMKPPLLSISLWVAFHLLSHREPFPTSFVCLFFLLHCGDSSLIPFRSPVSLMFLLLLLHSAPELNSKPCRNSRQICIETKHVSPSRLPFLLCNHPLLALPSALSTAPQRNNGITWFGAFGSVSLKHISL